MTSLKLHSTTAQVALLFEQEDRPRANARLVTVDREALKAVLMDHNLLIDAVNGRIATVEGIDE